MGDGGAMRGTLRNATRGATVRPMKNGETEWRRVSTRVPVGLYEALEGMAKKRGLILTEGKGQGDAAIGRTLAALIGEEVERTAKEPTLLGLAKSDPDRARSLILSAFDLSGGDGRAARAALGTALGRSSEVSDSDWKAARDRLDVGKTIKERWPKGRA